MAPSKFILMFIFLALYIGVSSLIGYGINAYIHHRPYKEAYDPLILGPTDYYGIGSVIAELSLSVGVLVLDILLLYESWYRTSNVHVGMKMVFHSIVFTSILTIFGRFVILYGYIIQGSVPIAVVSAAKYFVDVASLQFPQNPILMTIERAFATVRVKTYEGERPIFIFGIVVLSWTISIWLQFYCASSDQCVEIIVNVAYVQYFCLLCTILLMIALFRINLKRYRTKLPTSLSERYQTAENIRLLRAVLKFTVVNALSGLILQSFILIFTIKDQKLFMIIYHYSSDLWNVILAAALFCGIWFFLDLRKIGRNFRMIWSLKYSQNVVLKSVTGKVVPLQAAGDDYFKQLDRDWN